jgi:membrane protein DedA with SNARE-associated domain
MHIEQLLDQYGYLAVFVGVIIEGPITLTLAGLLVHQGYMSLFGVCASSFAGVFLVIELFYFIGMVAGNHLMTRWPNWGKYHSRFTALLERYKIVFLLGFRYLYGAHTFAPMAIGMARIRPAYFTAMNALGAAIWTLLYFLIGYFFGHAFELMIANIKRHERTMILSLIAAMLILYLARRVIFRRMAAKRRG